MIKIGIVGLGGMGTVHCNNYKHIPDCKVTAAVGRTEKDYQCAADWGIPVFATVDEMLDQVELDVVDVCTPTFLHFEHAAAALSRGVNVIVEKPVALHREDAVELYRLADENHVFMYVAQVLRFTPASKILQDLVKTQKYGRALDGNFERLSAAPQWSSGGWLFDKEKSGQLAFDLHIHDLDLIVSTFGKPRSYSYTSCGSPAKEYQEQFRFTYQYEGMNVSAEAAWFNAAIPFTARWRVYFEGALLVNDGSGLTCYLPEGEPIVYDISEKNPIPTGINVPPTEMFLLELRHFLDCVRQKKPSDVVKREEVLTVLEILEEAAFAP